MNAIVTLIATPFASLVLRGPLPFVPQGPSARVGAPPANDILECVRSLRDQAGGACLSASSTPTLGLLIPYPGDSNFFVPPAFAASGEDNSAGGPHSFIGGGTSNRTTGSRAVVAGGRFL